MEKDFELFTQILGADEQIIKTYRPNKFRVYMTSVIAWLFFLIIFGIMMIACESVWGIVGIAITYVVLVAVTMLFIKLWCNKTVYAVTNKRILIRTGYIGVDYRSLDYTMLGAITVNVSWLDKLLHKDTGVIAFGSMSSPLMANTVASRFSFSYIKHPYEVYKEVKAIIDANKNESKGL